MSDRGKLESIENNNEEMIVEESAVCVTDQDSDSQVMFEELCEELEDVIPTEILEEIKQVRPLEAAIELLWDCGGRIRMDHPEINLKDEYDYPKEVDDLNDTIGDFSFIVASSPFVAIAQAALGGINADEEIIQACDLKDYVPLIIEEEGEVKRICLIDYVSRKLEMPMGSLFNINVEMNGDPSERSAAMKEGLKELEGHLGALKQQVKEPPQMFANQKEEEAVRSWCDKHDYRVIGVFRAAIDCYH